MSIHKVKDFHDKFSIPIGGLGNMPPAERQMLRTRLMMEEMAELVEAMQTGDYVNVAKELADVLYVVYGTAVEYGVPMDEVFAEVHRSNMSKSPALDAGGKIKKGMDYEEANIETVLSDQQWRLAAQQWRNK